MSNTSLDNDKTSQTEILKLGSQGHEVKVLQEALEDLKLLKLKGNE